MHGGHVNPNLADQDRILRDFGIDPAHVSAGDRLKVIDTLNHMFLTAVTTRALDVLSDDKVNEFDALCEQAAQSPAGEGSAMISAFLAGHVDLDKVVTQAREDVRAHIRTGLRPLDDAKVEAERADDALGSLLEPLTDAAGNPVAEVGGLAVDFFFDPARGVRTKTEKQRWFAQKVATNVAKAIFGFWISLAAFTTCTGVERSTGWNVSNDWLAKALPTWFIQQPFSGQVKMLLLLVPILLVVVAIIIGFSVLFARTSFAGRLLERPIKEHDRASSVLHAEFARQSCDVSEYDLSRLAPLVYSGILLAAARSKERYENQKRLLDAALTSGGEDSAIRFVKSQVWGYRQRLRNQVADVVSHALPVMKIS
jgi:hypothetical protein